MGQAVGAKTRLSFVEETTLGTTPSSPSMKLLPYTKESLGTERGLFATARIKADRMVDEIRQGKRETKGDIAFELDAGTWGTFFKHLLGSVTTTGTAAPYTHTIKRGSALPAGGLSVEKGFLDLAQYLVFRGNRIDSLAMEFPTNGVTTGTWNIIGMYEGGGTGSGAGSASGASIGTPTDISDLPMMDWEGSAKIGGSANARVAAASFTAGNNMQTDGFGYGSQDRKQLGEGQGIVTGTATFFFENISDYNDFINGVGTSLELINTRNASNKVTIFFPAIVYGGGDATPKSGGPGPITIELPWHAKKDATEGTDIKVTIVNSQATI